MKFLNTLFLTALAVPMLGETVDFHRDIAPILREYCVGCHNNDDLDGELSVETFQLLLKGGENGAPIKPGDRAASLLAKVITKQVKPHMPPRREPQPAPTQVDTLLRWIDQGAKPPSDDRSIIANLTVPKIQPAGNALSPVTAMAISKNGQLAVGRYGRAEFGDKSFSGISGKVNAIAISSDNKFLAVAGGTPGLNGIATLFNLETGKKIRDLSNGHRDALYGIAFSPDGSQLATAGYDRLIQIWNPITGERLRTLEGHNGAVYEIAFSPDGRVLASSGGDSSVKLWNTTDGQR
ncbi:MAG: c-type cytochrome domain-containing protein, partial [Verrucomicrobiota bacterium]|nr:c-type cytochrome domain-containing protein [Verrucomicrobiota bacterium]